MKKQPLTAENIIANIDEYGIIHWERMEDFPDLVAPGEDLEITFVDPDGTTDKEVLKCKAKTEK